MTKSIFVRILAIMLCLVFMLGTSIIVAMAQTADEALVNLFPQSDKSVTGAIDANNQLVESNEYQTSDYIPVSKGDTIYFGAALISQRVHLALQDSAKKGIGTVVIGELNIEEELGKGYAICSYQIPEGVAYVRVIAQRGVYLDGSELVTLNQPFTSAQYFKMFDLNNIYAENGGVLYGKNVLFLGDDISYGLLDAPSYRASQRGWAGRLERDTGMIATNASTLGATMSCLGNRPWIGSQYLPYVNNDYDIIVIQGGVNDALRSLTIGSALPVDATDAELETNADCFIGGLQLLVRKLEKQWPDAKIFFVSTFSMDEYGSGSLRNMYSYFSPAGRICNELGISYINLNHNAEINKTLNHNDTLYLPDYFNPNAEGYEIITPYIKDAMVSAVEEDQNKIPDTTPTETTTSPDASATEDTSIDKTTNATETNAPTSEASKSDNNDGCASTASGAVMLCILVGTVALTALKKQKRE